jgi:hypothetical protein
MSIVLAFAAAMSALTAAQTATPPTADQAIVVEGVRNSRRRASDFLDKVIPPAFDARLGRFEDPICPSVLGLPPDLRDEVLARIRTVAAATRIRVSSGKCTPNLLLIVVPDKKEMIEAMRRERQAYLYGVGPDRISRMIKSPDSVASWQVSEVIGAEGLPLRTDGDGFPRLFTTVPPSRLTDTTRTRLLAGIVIVESRALNGISTRQLADYALVRTLSPIQQRDAQAPGSSVLSIFNPGTKPEDAPQSVTWWDVALLKALANTRSDMLASLQRSELRDQIVKEMAKVPAEQR